MRFTLLVPTVFAVMLLSCGSLLGQQLYLTNGSSLPVWGAAPNNRTMLDGPEPFRSKPIFGIEIGTIFLQRERPTPQNLVFDQTFTTVLLNANELDSRLTGGVRMTLDFFNAAESVPGLDAQARYYYVNDMSASETRTSTEVNPVFFFAVPLNPDAVTTTQYETTLRNVENNWLYRSEYLRGWRWIVGWRYLEINESLDFLFDQTANTRAGFFSKCQNEMFGIQGGAEWTFWTNSHSRLFASGKYAYMHNQVKGSGVMANGFLQYKDTEHSTLVEIELGAMLSITSWVGIRLGYIGIFGKDWAMAPDQNNSHTILPPAGSVTYSDPTWHGFNLSFEMAW